MFLSAPHRPVVALGMQDTLIIDTPDAVLVANVNHAEQVKQVVQRLKLDGAEQRRCSTGALPARGAVTTASTPAIATR